MPEKLSKQHLKKILANPDAEINNLKLPQKSEALIKVQSLLEDYKSLDSELNILRNRRGQLSRAIGAAKKNGEDTAELISEMKHGNTQLKSIETNLTIIEDHLSHILFSSHQSTSPDLKEQMTIKKLPDLRFFQQKEIELDKVKIKALGDDTEAWDEYVNNNPTCSIYHKSKWRELIKKTFNHDSVYLYAHIDNSIKGVLPLIRMKSKLFGDFLVSVPYFNYGGAHAVHKEIEQKLIEQANIMAKELGVGHIEYRDDLSRPEYPQRTDKINLILPLPDSVDELWHSFTPKLRAQIKRPQRENPSYEIGGANLLDEYYEVFSKNMRNLGTPVYSKLFFKNIISAFPDNVNILLVRISGKPAGAAFLLGYMDKLEIPWASTLPEFNKFSINMYLYWKVLSFAINNKYRYFDFGRSSINSGTYRFKKQWGAIDKASYWHYWLNEGMEMPALNPSNPKFAFFIAIWKKLPLYLTKLIGPHIVKNLP